MNLEQVKIFIDTNNSRPSATSKNKDEKVLGSWISNQLTNYKKKTKIMKDEEIYNTWTEFIDNDKYKQYFK